MSEMKPNVKVETVPAEPLFETDMIRNENVKKNFLKIEKMFMMTQHFLNQNKYYNNQDHKAFEDKINLLLREVVDIKKRLDLLEGKKEYIPERDNPVYIPCGCDENDKDISGCKNC